MRSVEEKAFKRSAELFIKSWKAFGGGVRRGDPYLISLPSLLGQLPYNSTHPFSPVLL